MHGGEERKEQAFVKHLLCAKKFGGLIDRNSSATRPWASGEGVLWVRLGRVRSESSTRRGKSLLPRAEEVDLRSHSDLLWGLASS